jgi:hypothetical protein
MKRLWAVLIVALILGPQVFETTNANVANKAAKAAKAAAKASESQRKPLDLAPAPSGGAAKGKGADEAIQPPPDSSMQGGAIPGNGLEHSLNCARESSNPSTSPSTNDHKKCKREPSIDLRREPNSTDGKFKGLERAR